MERVRPSVRPVLADTWIWYAVALGVIYVLLQLTDLATLSEHAA